MCHNDFNKDLNTDITLGTAAETMWRFYSETRLQIADLEMKRELYLREYLKEMRKAKIPMELRGEFLSAIQNYESSCETPKEKEMRSTRIQILKENIFSQDFLKDWKVEFAGKMTGGYEGYYYTVRFNIGDMEYRLQCPNPSALPEKLITGQGACFDYLKYRADCIPISKANDLVKELECVCFPTYDWKKCCRAIENHVRNTPK